MKTGEYKFSITAAVINPSCRRRIRASAAFCLHSETIGFTFIKSGRQHQDGSHLHFSLSSPSLLGDFLLLLDGLKVSEKSTGSKECGLVPSIPLRFYGYFYKRMCSHEPESLSESTFRDATGAQVGKMWSESQRGTADLSCCNFHRFVEKKDSIFSILNQQFIWFLGINVGFPVDSSNKHRLNLLWIHLGKQRTNQREERITVKANMPSSGDPGPISK